MLVMKMDVGNDDVLDLNKKYINSLCIIRAKIILKSLKFKNEIFIDAEVRCLYNKC